MNFAWLIPAGYIGVGLTVLMLMSRRHADLTAYERLVIVVGWLPMWSIYVALRIALAIADLFCRLV